MKKAYSKPDIFFESFTLSTSIAASCNTQANNLSEAMCGMRFGSFSVFVGGVSGCSTEVEDGGAMFDGLCYHVPTQLYNLFGS